MLLIWEAISADPQKLIRSILRLIHFIGLAIGLGTATLLDLMILKFFMATTVREQKFDVFAFCTRVVNIGLIMLWVSGIGFILYYWKYDPVLLTNEKIHAKIAIVCILTINGFFIHRIFLPFLETRLGRYLLEGVPLSRQHVLVTSAVISGVSWYTPLLIANLPQLNFSVPMMKIMGAYGLLMACAMLVAYVVLSVLTINSLVSGKEPPRRMMGRRHYY